MDGEKSASLSSTFMNYVDHEDTHSFTEFSDFLLEEEDFSVIEPKPRRHYTAKQKAWKGQYCCVPLCRSSSGEKAQRERLGMLRLLFHSFPDVTTDKGKMWIAKIRRDPGKEFVINNNTKVCSLHFTPDDYISGDLQSARRVLDSCFCVSKI